MRIGRMVPFAVMACLVAASLAAAGEKSPAVTLEGSLMCAHCTLKEAGWKSCQSVVVVKDKDGSSQNYYVVSNDVAKKFGHVCNDSKPVKITGEVVEKDGKKWIAPTEMSPVEKS